MKMKNILKFSITGFMLVMAVVTFSTFAFSADKVLTASVDSVITKLDKNGAEYTRIIVLEKKKVQGVEYASGTPAMAFGSLNDQAKTMSAGDELKAVVEAREYQGRTSYTIKAFLP